MVLHIGDMIILLKKRGGQEHFLIRIIHHVIQKTLYVTNQLGGTDIKSESLLDKKDGISVSYTKPNSVCTGTVLQVVLHDLKL